MLSRNRSGRFQATCNCAGPASRFHGQSLPETTCPLRTTRRGLRRTSEIRERVAIVGHEVGDGILAKRFAETKILPCIDRRCAKSLLWCDACADESENFEADFSVVDCGVGAAENGDTFGHSLRKLALDGLNGFSERLFRHAQLSRSNALKEDAKGGERGSPRAATRSHLLQMLWLKVRAVFNGVDIKRDSELDCCGSSDVHRDARAGFAGSLDRRTQLVDGPANVGIRFGMFTVRRVANEFNPSTAKSGLFGCSDDDLVAGNFARCIREVSAGQER